MASYSASGLDPGANTGSETAYPYAEYSSGALDLNLKVNIFDGGGRDDITYPVYHLPNVRKPYSLYGTVLQVPNGAYTVDVYFADGTGTPQPKVLRDAADYPFTITTHVHNNSSLRLVLKSSAGNWVTTPPQVINAWSDGSYTSQGGMHTGPGPDDGSPDVGSAAEYTSGAVDLNLHTYSLSSEADPKLCDSTGSGYCSTWTHLDSPYTITSKTTNGGDPSNSTVDWYISDGSTKP